MRSHEISVLKEGRPRPPPEKRRVLLGVLRASAAFLFLYFTLSHWFFPRTFFHALGIANSEVASGFVLSQLRLIGAMVAGYAAILAIAAHDVDRHRPVVWAILAVGVMCVAVFAGQVSAGTLPPPFLLNAAILGAQVLLTAGLLRGTPRSARMAVRDRVVAMASAPSSPHDNQDRVR